MFHIADLARHVIGTVKTEVHFILVARDERDPWRRPRASLRDIKGRMATDVQEFAADIFEMMKRVTALATEIAAHMLGIMVHLIEILLVIQYWSFLAAVEVYERAWEWLRRRVWYPVEEVIDRWWWRRERRRTPPS